MRIKEKTFIGKLMEDYKKAVREERNIQPLSDDYIKFIRFAHDRIERTRYGIIGMITNHTYLSGLIHRGMREELMKSFSEIYILDLHGSAPIREIPADGRKDENIFDIQQGVAISLFVRKPKHKGMARVHHADLCGPREHKYSDLAQKDVSTTEWQELEPTSPYYFFVPKELDLQKEYDEGWSVASIFAVNSSGIKTHRDRFVIDFDQMVLRERMAIFRGRELSDEQVQQRFPLGRLNIAQARQKVRQDGKWRERFIPCLYRPFDVRTIFYSNDVIDRPRTEVMRHMLMDNLALITQRQLVLGTGGYTHFGVSNNIVEVRCFYSREGHISVFPLYVYPDDEEIQKKLEPEEGRKPNLAPEFIKAIEEKLGSRFVPDGRGDLKENFGPEDVFYYAYTVFHSPTYRTRYEEFLKIDFPRLPLTSDRALFAALVEKGAELVALHLMESSTLGIPIIKYPITGSDQVEKVRYVEPRKKEGEEIPGRVYINKEQYFEGIAPEVWNFHIGGYQVLNKWLKDRRGRKLSIDDSEHYQKIVVALKETMRLMEEIDGLIPSWPVK